jgi:hypothetical protein
MTSSCAFFNNSTPSADSGGNGSAGGSGSGCGVRDFEGML